jgi:hypothetical protein
LCLCEQKIVIGKVNIEIKQCFGKKEALDPKEVATIKCPQAGSKKQVPLPFPHISFPYLLLPVSNLNAPAHAPECSKQNLTLYLRLSPQ